MKKVVDHTTNVTYPSAIATAQKDHDDCMRIMTTVMII